MTEESAQLIRDDGAYPYSALPDGSSIRLLRRLGRDAPGPLRFSLQAYSLDDPDLGYHCLSYTWGNPFAHGRRFEEFYNDMNPLYTPYEGETIIVDGCPMKVSRNLYEALATLPENAYQDYVNRPTTEQGGTVIHGAAKKGRCSYLRHYIARGADPNIADEKGQTALHHAAAGGFADCVEVLCKGGALRERKNKDGETPEDAALSSGRHETVRLLREWKPRPDPETPSIQREEDGPGELIWIDAICINQSNIEEKGTQVSMMDLIYSRASFVVAWLGPEDNHTEAGLRALHTLSRHADKFRQSQIEPFAGTDENHYKDAVIPLITKNEWDGLASIYQRQWFRRAWIVQEAVLPDTLIAYCGRHMLSIHELGVVAESIRITEARSGTSRSRSYAPLNDIAVSVEWNMAEVFKWRENMYWTHRGETEEERRKYREGFTLGRLVGDFRTFLASDARDKVFSLGGILNVFGGERSGADYRRPAASVFAEATRRIISEEGNLQVLASCAHGAGNPRELPSWVPDFAVPGAGAVPAFVADGNLPFSGLGEQVADSPVLTIQGVRVGTISEAGGRVSTAPGGKMMFDPSWLRLVLSLRGTHGPSEEKPLLTEMLWRTLCMNTTAAGLFNSDRFQKEAPDEMGSQFLIFMSLMVLTGADQKMLESVGLEANQQRETHTIIHSPACDPWEGDLAETLKHLDTLLEHDGEKCLTPTSREVLMLWSNLKYTLMRTTPIRDDGSPLDFSVSPSVLDGTDRIVGRGVVSADSPVYQKCRDFGAAYLAAYGGRQLVTVDGRFLGLAPVAAATRDEVWVFPGLNAPAVLRRIGDDSQEDIADRFNGVSLEEASRYSFVGIAYVHDIMNGEAVCGREAELRAVGLA